MCKLKYYNLILFLLLVSLLLNIFSPIIVNGTEIGDINGSIEDNINLDCYDLEDISTEEIDIKVDNFLDSDDLDNLSDIDGYDFVYKVENDTYVIEVHLKEDVIPDGSELKVEYIDKESITYQGISNDLFGFIDFDDFIAFDIYFEKDDERISLSDNIYVEFELLNMIPKTADMSTLAINHHKENFSMFYNLADENNVFIETVASMNDGILIDNDILSANFETDGFSIYTITWQNGTYILNLNYVDLEENSIYPGDSVTVADEISGDGNTPMSLYADLIDHEDYVYRYAYVYDNGVKTPINYLSCNVTKGSWFYTTSMTRNDWVTWTNMDTETVTTADVYLVYSKPILNDIHDNIKITLFDYGSYINSGTDKVLKFLKTLDNHTQIDGAGVGSVTATSNPPEMKNVLVNGYPALSNGKSLKYLFHQDGSDFIKGAGTMTSYDTMRSSATWTAANGYTTYYESMRFSLGNDGGLFELDENGYFKYSCANNAAYFNGTRFELYDNLISPGHKKGDMSGNNGWNFYPFDNPIPSTKNSIGIHPENGKEVYFTGYSVEEDSAGTITYYNEKNTVANMWYGMYMTFDLYTPRDGQINGEDMIFEFKGDDDVWVYLDDVLVLNIGGTHGAQEGKINFSTGEVSDPQSTGTIKSRFEDAGKDTSDFDGDTFNSYTKHTLHFYYLERGGNIGYCSLIFNTPTLPNESLMVSKEVESNSIDSQIIEETLEYGYRVLAVDDGVLTDDLFINSGETFDIIENDMVIDIGVVDKNGYFYLKSGQTALFSEMLEKGNGYLSYVVEEVLPNDLKGQYGNIKYSVSGNGGVFIPDDEKSDGVVSETFTEYRTPILEGDESNIIKYTNIVDITHLSSLSITKNADPFLEYLSPFEIQVTLGGKLLPVGTVYKINDIEYTVETEGIILLNNNETAIIEGIVSGTEFEIIDIEANENNVVYTGVITDSDGAREIGNNGLFTLGSSVDMVIVNTADEILADVLPDTGGNGKCIYYFYSLVSIFIGFMVLKKNFKY